MPGWENIPQGCGPPELVFLLIAVGLLWVVFQITYTNITKNPQGDIMGNRDRKKEKKKPKDKEKKEKKKGPKPDTSPK